MRLFGARCTLLSFLSRGPCLHGMSVKYTVSRTDWIPSIWIASILLVRMPSIFFPMWAPLRMDDHLKFKGCGDRIFLPCMPVSFIARRVYETEVCYSQPCLLKIEKSLNIWTAIPSGACVHDEGKLDSSHPAHPSPISSTAGSSEPHMHPGKRLTTLVAMARATRVRAPQSRSCFA